MAGLHKIITKMLGSLDKTDNMKYELIKKKKSKTFH